MDLRTYMDELPRGRIADLAEALGISSVYLQQLASRQDGREPGPELCVRIEHETKVVTRRELRRDWHLIWPELVTRGYPAPGAAADPQPEAQA